MLHSAEKLWVTLYFDRHFTKYFFIYIFILLKLKKLSRELLQRNCKTSAFVTKVLHSSETLLLLIKELQYGFSSHLKCILKKEYKTSVRKDNVSHGNIFIPPKFFFHPSLFYFLFHVPLRPLHFKYYLSEHRVKKKNMITDKMPLYLIKWN